MIDGRLISLRRRGFLDSLIRGQMGSGAPNVGKEMARLIQGDYVDRQILADVAELVGRPVTEVEKKELR